MTVDALNAFMQTGQYTNTTGQRICKSHDDCDKAVNEFKDPMGSPARNKRTQANECSGHHDVTLQQTETEKQHNLFQIEEDKGVEHQHDEARTLSMLVTQVTSGEESEQSSSMQQFDFNKGPKEFGDEGKEAAPKEVRQQHVRPLWIPCTSAWCKLILAMVVSHGPEVQRKKKQRKRKGQIPNV